MFNLGFTELLLLGLIALIFIGPHQLPEVARTLGRLINEWKRATSDFQSTITTHLTEEVQQRREQIVEGDAPSDHDIAVKVEQETPPSAELPAGVAPIAEAEPEKKS